MGKNGRTSVNRREIMIREIGASVTRYLLGQMYSREDSEKNHKTKEYRQGNLPKDMEYMVSDREKLKHTNAIADIVERCMDRYTEDLFLFLCDNLFDLKVLETDGKFLHAVPVCDEIKRFYVAKLMERWNRQITAASA